MPRKGKKPPRPSRPSTVAAREIEKERTLEKKRANTESHTPTRDTAAATADDDGTRAAESLLTMHARTKQRTAPTAPISPLPDNTDRSRTQLQLQHAQLTAQLAHIDKQLRTMPQADKAPAPPPVFDDFAAAAMGGGSDGEDSEDERPPPVPTRDHRVGTKRHRHEKATCTKRHRRTRHSTVRRATRCWAPSRTF